jgi:hypothetical protein
MARRSFREGPPTGPQPIGALIPAVYPSTEPEEFAAVRAFAWWVRAVPERVARNARPVSLRRGVLLVHAATSAWASELSFLEDALLAAVRRAAPEAGIRALRIRVGPLPPAPVLRDPRPPPAPEPPADAPLPEDVARSVARIGVESVRAAVARAARAALHAMSVRDDAAREVSGGRDATSRRGAR